MSAPLLSRRRGIPLIDYPGFARAARKAGWPDKKIGAVLLEVLVVQDRVDWIMELADLDGFDFLGELAAS